MKKFNYGISVSGLALIIAAVFLALSCAKGASKLKYDFYSGAAPAQPYPDVSFAVMTDIHVYDTSLGSSGTAFEKTMNSDRKLLLDSIDLLDYAIGTISGSGVDFVLIAGDLTKDGEAINHEIVASMLGRFTEQGIKVYVVPGNHDINNPDSVSYFMDSTSQVPTVSADDFARIYGGYGFNAALMRDDDSLSYVAEPVDGLWLLALDACRYRENQPGKQEIVSGKVSQKTADWIASVLNSAIEQNKAVMVMMHHGVVEHWAGQSKLHPDYLIDDYSNFGKFLASYNVRLAYTGHYHALDIARGDFGDKFIYDIETGSLITAPCPIRFAKINDNRINIRTETIVGKLYPDTDFAANAYAFVKKTVMLEAEKTLKKFKVNDRDARYMSDAVGDAFNAHYAGDEDPAMRPPFDSKKLGFWGRIVYKTQQYALDGLWADIAPEDRDVSLEL